MPEKGFNTNNLKKKLADLTKKMGRGELLWPLRIALTGKKASPPPFEIMEILGKKKTVHRLDNAIKMLEKYEK